MDSSAETPIRQSLFEETRKENESILGKYLPQELKDRQSKVRVLSVGCGTGVEAPAIQKLVPNSEYLGIDISPGIISLARASNPAVDPEVFKIADALYPTSFGETPWDLIILKHPQIRGDGPFILQRGIREDWKKIFKNVAKFLKEDGFVYISSNVDTEISDTVDYLANQLGLKIVVPITEVEEKLLTSKFPLRDEFVAVLKRTS